MRWVRVCLNWFMYRLSFVGKLRLLFCGGIIFPMLVLNVVNYWQTERNVQEELIETMNTALDDKAEKIEAVLEETVSLARGYNGREELYQYLDRQYDKKLDCLVLYQELITPMFAQERLYPYHVKAICMYCDNPTLLNGTYVKRMVQESSETLGEELVYLNCGQVAGEDKILFRIAHKDNRYMKLSGSRSMSILCVMDHYRAYDSYEKIMRIDLDLDYLGNLLKETGLFQNILLVDSGDRVVAAANSYNSAELPPEFDRKGEETQKTVLLSRTVGRFPLVLYGSYDREAIAREFRQSRWNSVTIFLVCLLLALVFIYVLAESMNRRLAALTELSVEISKGNFIQSRPEQEGRDEFSVLEKSMNQMSLRLEELIDRDYKAQLTRMELEKETNQARLLALQSQVNPHFMFNALESIRLKALMKGEKETAGVIRYLARMFRNLLEWDNNVISMEEEIGFLDEFLHIQSYRFEDEFSYEIHVSREAAGCRIPKMLLQPLVENACVHGVEAITEDRWLMVWADVQNGWLEVAVEDNGGGMPPERLQELQRMLGGEQPNGKSVGLWNVNKRLTLSYGKEAGLHLESVQGRGTRCFFHIPAQLSDEPAD